MEDLFLCRVCRRPDGLRVDFCAEVCYVGEDDVGGFARVCLCILAPADGRDVGG
jgi:hypothetical protein